MIRMPSTHNVLLTTLVSLTLLAGVSSFNELHAAEYTVQSPNGVNALRFTVDQDGVKYAVLRHDQPIITPTPISVTVDGQKLPNGAATDDQQTSVDRILKPVVPTIASEIREHFNELTLEFEAAIRLRARAYDDGVAFRWELNSAKAEVTVDAEQLAYHFTRNCAGYFPDLSGNTGGDYFTHHEPMYRWMSLDAYDNQTTNAAPFLLKVGDDDWLLITDMNVRSYPGLWLRGAGSPQLTGEFARYPLKTAYTSGHGDKPTERAAYLARTKGQRSLPWRAFVLGDSAGLLTSTMLYCLADPSEFEDTSWIKVGKVVWDWWHNWNLYGVNFRAGINQDTYKYYIDFAAEIGAPYVILDEGWNLKGRENLLKVKPELDLPKLSAYAKQHGVGLILWLTSDEAEMHFDKAFEQFTEWGIAGLKLDFVQRDDQAMMDFLERFAKEAAQRHLLVDIHGGPKPMGLNRIWPNVVTLESVVGLENSKWSEKANPEMAVTIPFTRMMVGPMDYTPGAMVNLQQREFKPMFSTPASQGTRCQQLAMYVVYVSPLQMLCDMPMNYHANPECLAFLKEVPTTWDETHVLTAQVGGYVLLARRSGQDWYIGGMTNWEPRDLSGQLDFLGEGKYQMTAYKDGLNADRNGLDYRVETSTVDRTTMLKLWLAPGGGFAAKLTPQ